MSCPPRISGCKKVQEGRVQLAIHRVQEGRGQLAICMEPVNPKVLR